MFSGKREKVLEEELVRVKAQSEKQGSELAWISGQKKQVEEQFAELLDSQGQMERDMAQISGHLDNIQELAENGGRAASDVHTAMMELNNGVGTFEVNHGVFLEQVHRHNDRIVEIVENNKHFTTPMKQISELPSARKEEAKEIQACVDRMKDFSKNMTVISLNTAIEAGRLGETGRKFVASLDELCSYTGYYDSEVRQLEEKLRESDAKWEALEEQIQHLNKLLKENNISMGKLMRDSAQSMATYEVSQLKLRELLPETAVGQADALQQSAREMTKVCGRMQMRVEDIRGEADAWKKRARELKEACGEICERAGGSGD